MQLKKEKPTEGIIDIKHITIHIDNFFIWFVPLILWRKFCNPDKRLRQKLPWDPPDFAATWQNILIPAGRRENAAGL